MVRALQTDLVLLSRADWECLLLAALCLLLSLSACARRESPAEQWKRENVVRAELEKQAQAFDEDQQVLFNGQTIHRNRP